MKYFKYLLFLIFLCPISVLASTRTYTRTREKPLVPERVVVDDVSYPFIAKTPAVDSSEKIYDFAEILTEREENLLYKQLDNYIRYSKIDAVVITIGDISKLNGLSLDVYASHFYEYNYFDEDGVILAIYAKEDINLVYITAFGNQALSKYTDVRRQQILNSIHTSVEEGEYYDAVQRAITTLDGFYKAKEKGNYVIDDKGVVSKYIPWIEIIILGVSFTFLFVLFFLYRIYSNNILKYKDNLASKIDPDTLMIQTEVENFIGNVLADKK